jgi:hypothetical protein
MYIAEIQIDEVHTERALKEEKDLLAIVRFDPRTKGSICSLMLCSPVVAEAVMDAAKSGTLSVLHER